jgi:hypothetical protein
MRVAASSVRLSPIFVWNILLQLFSWNLMMNKYKLFHFRMHLNTGKMCFGKMVLY